MAIFHMSAKAVSRSGGRSATGSAAYRAGEKITDKRTGEVHDYTRKGGVEDAVIVMPTGSDWTPSREELWNAAELSEKRKDACVAREFEVALPAELSADERQRLAVDFARHLADSRGCAVDVAIHAPGRGGDTRNHHAHILCTTRRVDGQGLGDKLDTEKAGRNRKADLEAVRAHWADMVNERLRENGHAERVDHRSLKDQGIDREPTQHLGPAATGYERRTGQPSNKRQDWQREAADRLAAARAQGQADRDLSKINDSILDLSGDLAAAKRDRAALVQTVDSGKADIRAMFEQYKQAEKARQEAERRQALEAERQRARDLERQRIEREQREKAEHEARPRPSRGHGMSR